MASTVSSLRSWWRRLAATAEGLDGAPEGSPRAALASAVVGAWGSVRLLVTAPLSPLLGAAVFARAWRNTTWVKELIERFPATIDDIARGGAPEQPDLRGQHLRVARRPASGRYVVTSDLHRSFAGRMDWAAAQETKRLYVEMLERYADDGWTLVENGDVEDFWLTGGSAYGVAYDLARIGANLLPSALRASVLPAIYGDHVDRFAANNTEVHRVIRESFGPERYLRLVGNHDDAYLDESVVDRLRRHLPGVEMWDVVVLDQGPDAIGVVLHGHQTDPWNLPGRDFLGKYCTWLATALIDAPFLRATPGMPDHEQAAALLAGRASDRLMAVDRHVGVNLDFYSLDEMLLADSWRRWYGDGPAPVLVMGHTHVPLVDPLPAGADADDEASAWVGYVNSGCGVLHRAVTCVEWDGTADPENPQVRLVVWHREGGDAAGGPPVREQIERRPGSDLLDRPHEVAP